MSAIGFPAPTEERKQTPVAVVLATLGGTVQPPENLCIHMVIRLGPGIDLPERGIVPVDGTTPHGIEIKHPELAHLTVLFGILLKQGPDLQITFPAGFCGVIRMGSLIGSLKNGKEPEELQNG